MSRYIIVQPAGPPVQAGGLLSLNVDCTREPTEASRPPEVELSQWVAEHMEGITYGHEIFPGGVPSGRAKNNKLGIQVRTTSGQAPIPSDGEMRTFDRVRVQFLLPNAPDNQFDKAVDRMWALYALLCSDAAQSIDTRDREQTYTVWDTTASVSLPGGVNHYDHDLVTDFNVGEEWVYDGLHISGEASFDITSLAFPGSVVTAVQLRLRAGDALAQLSLTGASDEVRTLTAHSDTWINPFHFGVRINTVGGEDPEGAVVTIGGTVTFKAVRPS